MTRYLITHLDPANQAGAALLRRDLAAATGLFPNSATVRRGVFDLLDRGAATVRLQDPAAMRTHCHVTPIPNNGDSNV